MELKSAVNKHTRMHEPILVTTYGHVAQSPTTAIQRGLRIQPTNAPTSQLKRPPIVNTSAHTLPNAHAAPNRGQSAPTKVVSVCQSVVNT